VSDMIEERQTGPPQLEQVGLRNGMRLGREAKKGNSPHKKQAAETCLGGLLCFRAAGMD